MKKFAVQTILLLIIIGVALVFFSPAGQTTKLDIPFLPQPPRFQTLQINDSKLNVEIADTESKRNKGLSGRNSLGVDEGMLFIYPNLGKHAFWMKGMKFPLDFVWINNRKVIDLIPGVPPPVAGEKDQDLSIYTSKFDADKILEVNVGVINRLNIKIGDTIKLSP